MTSLNLLFSRGSVYDLSHLNGRSRLFLPPFSLCSVIFTSSFHGEDVSKVATLKAFSLSLCDCCHFTKRFLRKQTMLLLADVFRIHKESYNCFVIIAHSSIKNTGSCLCSLYSDMLKVCYFQSQQRL